MDGRGIINLYAWEGLRKQWIMVSSVSDSYGGQVYISEARERLRKHHFCTAVARMSITKTEAALAR